MTSRSQSPVQSGLKVELRIDVDTFRGTRIGVPNLCRLLKARGIRATFFFSVGPDNMGRHLWRLLRPAFLLKMLRSRAASLYGWDILLKGTFWPGPRIGAKLGAAIRAAAADGHEIGVHAWDHHAWQSRIDRMDAAEIDRDLRRAFDELTRIVGTSPTCSAAPSWKANDLVLSRKMEFPFRFNSDCRGTGVFVPIVGGSPLQIQVPVTLPTYDESIGQAGLTDATYNEFLLSRLVPDGLNVLTIHAEVEGDSRMHLFKEFLDLAQARGVDFTPLGDCVGQGPWPRGKIVSGTLSGREGWVAVQEPISG